MKDGEEAFFEEIVNFDSGYRIGAHMQSRWENYCRIFAELSQFRAKRLYFTEWGPFPSTFVSIFSSI